MPERAAVFEQGPIRPPNEAYSLLVRVTRNCPWNRCTFCPVYKGQTFSLRPPEEVMAEIDAMAELCTRIAEELGPDGEITPRLVAMLRQEGQQEAVQLVRFVADGGESAFLQDANSLVMPVSDGVRVLRHLRRAFPAIRRVTTYARSHTLTRRSVDELRSLREAGLDRVHVGLESGSDAVLELADKGATGGRHIGAGRRAKEAGLELSTYVMPGLGGKALSEEHARDTARVLAAIDPHFIRLRTLSVPAGSALAAELESGAFELLDDVEIVRELRQLIAGLEGVQSRIVSDHALNLLEELEGQLPEALPHLLERIDHFLGLDDELRDTFIVGRRFGLLRRLDDLEDDAKRERAAQILEQLRQRTNEPMARVAGSLMSRLM